MENIINDVIDTVGSVTQQAGTALNELIGLGNVTGDTAQPNEQQETESKGVEEEKVASESRRRGRNQTQPRSVFTPDLTSPSEAVPLVGADTLGQVPPESKAELDAGWRMQFYKNKEIQREHIEQAATNSEYRSPEYLKATHDLYLLQLPKDEQDQGRMMLNDLALTGEEEDNFRVEQTHAGSEATDTDPAITSSYGIKGERLEGENMLHQAVRYYKKNILPSIEKNSNAKGWSPEERARRVRVAINTGRTASLKANYDPLSTIGWVYAKDDGNKKGYGMMAGLIHNRIIEYNEIEFTNDDGIKNGKIASYKITEDANGAASVTYTFEDSEKYKPITKQGGLKAPIHADSSKYRVGIDIPVNDGEFSYDAAHSERIEELKEQRDSLVNERNDNKKYNKPEEKKRIKQQLDSVEAELKRWGGT